MADGKVVYEYVGDTSGIDKANQDAEKKIKISAANAEDDIKKGSKATSDEVASHVSGAGDKIGSVAKAAGVAIGTAFTAASAAAVAFGKKGIDLASDLTEVQNVVDTTFGENASKINDFSKAAAANFGESELQAKKYTSTLGAMLKSMGLSADATADMSEGMAGLAGDFASFYNLQPDEAFEKIKSGISGETEPLKALGINMSDANLKAFALTQGMDGNIQKLDAAGQAQLRYAYLMSVSKDAQGDFAKTSDSFANQQRILSMQFDSLAATVGQTLLPVMTDAIGFLTKTLSDPAVSNGLKDWFAQISQIAQQALPPLIQAIQQVTPALGQIVTGLLPPLLQTVSQILPPLIQLIQAILPTIVSLISTLLPPIVQIVQQIMPVLVQILNTLLPPLMQILQAVLPPLLSIINALLPPILEIIKSLLPPLSELLLAIVPIIQMLTPLIQWLAGIIGDYLGGAIKSIIPIVDNIIGVFTNLIKFVKDVFTGNWREAWEDIKNIFSDYFGALGGLVKLPVNLIIDGLNAMIKGVNELKIPDWVPGIGGKGISIPLIPKLAKGGLAFGPQLAMVGDNPNASVDPEVVAPLSKLQAMLSGTVQHNYAFSGGSQTIIVQPAQVQLSADARKMGLSATAGQWAESATRRYR